MTWKQIEASREARLWIRQIVIPVVGIIALVPEARTAVVTKAKEVKNAIKTKREKK